MLFVPKLQKTYAKLQSKLRWSNDAIDSDMENMKRRDDINLNKQHRREQIK